MPQRVTFILSAKMVHAQGASPTHYRPIPMVLRSPFLGASEKVEAGQVGFTMGGPTLISLDMGR